MRKTCSLLTTYLGGKEIFQIITRGSEYQSRKLNVWGFEFFLFSINNINNTFFLRRSNEMKVLDGIGYASLNKTSRVQLIALQNIRRRI